MLRDQRKAKVNEGKELGQNLTQLFLSDSVSKRLRNFIVPNKIMKLTYKKREKAEIKHFTLVGLNVRLHCLLSGTALK